MEKYMNNLSWLTDLTTENKWSPLENYDCKKSGLTRQLLFIAVYVKAHKGSSIIFFLNVDLNPFPHLQYNKETPFLEPLLLVE